MSKIWLITGANRGLGAAIGRAVLAAGHRLIATARDPGTAEKALGGPSDRLLVVKLDVTDDKAVAAAIAQAEEKWGGIDVLVNNAGYGQMGAFEEVSAADIETQFRTNVFGLFAVTRAVLPILRRQKAGHIFNLSSMLGIQGVAYCSIYSASKFAVTGYSEALAGELASFGIKVTVVEPGVFRTDFLDDSSMRFGGVPINDYAAGSARVKSNMAAGNHAQAGDPVKLAAAILQLAEAPDAPVHFPVGSDAIKRAESRNASLEKEIARWREVSEATAFQAG